ncbi:MAG: MiaB/RimO family radical SAM methylthiotransferase [Candidatus Ratteibacteria bacterium]
MVEILTFGCKVNQYESQLIKENIEMNENFKDGDIVVINSCCVTEKVERDVKKKIKKLLKEKKKVYLTGCLVEKNGIKDEIAGVKIIKKEEFFKYKNRISNFDSHTRAFIKIEDGCENFCSYCIIPYVRGNVRSRSQNDIIDEINCLAERGYKEIVLTGIDLGAYGKDIGTDLISLIEKIERIGNVKRIRISSIEIYYINEKLIDFLKFCEKFCPHFHIPLQSGSDRILNLMRRRYTFDDYYRKIEMIKEKIENVTFTTDIMIGFPGEKEDDFEKTCNAVEKIEFLKLHIFPYSERENTPATKFPEKIDERIKKERFKRLQKIASLSSKKVKEKFIGKNLTVLFERKKEIFWEGYSGNYIPVIVNSQKDLKNQIVNVVPEKILKDALFAKIEQK